MMSELHAASARGFQERLKGCCLAQASASEGMGAGPTSLAAHQGCLTVHTGESRCLSAVPAQHDVSSWDSKHRSSNNFTEQSPTRAVDCFTNQRFVSEFTQHHGQASSVTIHKGLVTCSEVASHLWCSSPADRSQRSRCPRLGGSRL